MTERVLDGAAAFGAAEVRQLQAADAVAGCPDLRVRGAQEFVDLDVVAVVDDDAGLLEADPAGLGATADRDEQQIGVDRGAVVEVRLDASAL